MVKNTHDHSNFLYWLTFAIIVALCLVYVFNKLAFAETKPPLIVPVPTPPSHQPAVIITPSGQTYYAHPAQTPNGPVTVITPSGSPIYSHPAPSAYGPATVITPGELPTFVWPGVNP